MVLKKSQPRVASSAVSITLSSGDGQSAVTFEAPMKDTNYIVLASVEEDLSATAVHFFLTSKTVNGFTLDIVSDSAAGTASVRWTAIPSVLNLQ